MEAVYAPQSAPLSVRRFGLTGCIRLARLADSDPEVRRLEDLEAVLVRGYRTQVGGAAALAAMARHVDRAPL